jgi:hypothetical protein
MTAMNTNVTRRRAMSIGVGGLGAALLFWRRRGSPGGDSASVCDRVLALFEHRSAAAAIGSAVLQRYPHERDRQWLLAQLLADAPEPASRWLQSDDSLLHDWLRQRMRGDFANARTVWVDGWLLAQTEARLCALAALA